MSPPPLAVDFSQPNVVPGVECSLWGAYAGCPFHQEKKQAALKRTQAESDDEEEEVDYNPRAGF